MTAPSAEHAPTRPVAVGRWTLVALVVGSMVGAGVYSYAREGLGRYAGFLSAFGYYLTAVARLVPLALFVRSRGGPTRHCAAPVSG